MELTAQWSYVFRPPRWQNQRGGGIQDGMQPILQLTRDTSENWVAVVHLADNQCTHDVREINTRSGSVVEPRSTLWQQLWRGSSWSYQCQCRPWGRRSKKLAARQWCQCGPDQTGSNVVDEKTNTRGPQSWRNSAAADWMPSKPKPHRHRRTLSRRGRQNLRVCETRRSECRPHRREGSAGGTSLTAAGQRCTEGIWSARGLIPVVLRTELLAV